MRGRQRMPTMQAPVARAAAVMSERQRGRPRSGPILTVPPEGTLKPREGRPGSRGTHHDPDLTARPSVTFRGTEGLGAPFQREPHTSSPRVPRAHRHKASCLQLRVVIQPTGDRSAALGHRWFPKKGGQALHRPYATEFKVKRSPSVENLLETGSGDGCTTL